MKFVERWILIFEGGLEFENELFSEFWDRRNTLSVSKQAKNSLEFSTTKKFKIHFSHLSFKQTCSRICSIFLEYKLSTVFGKAKFFKILPLLSKNFQSDPRPLILGMLTIEDFGSFKNLTHITLKHTNLLRSCGHSWKRKQTSSVPSSILAGGARNRLLEVDCTVVTS